MGARDGFSVGLPVGDTASVVDGGVVGVTLGATLSPSTVDGDKLGVSDGV